MVKFWKWNYYLHLDMGYVKNEELKNDGKVLDLSNSGLVVQPIEMEKVWGGGRRWGEA